MFILRSFKTIFISIIIVGISFPSFSASKYPKSTLYILFSAKKKLKKSDIARKRVKEIAFKSATNSLKKEMNLLIRAKKLDEAKALRDRIREIEKATPGEEINPGNITFSSKKIIQQMNQKCTNADTHFQKSQKKIQDGLIGDIEQEMLTLDKRGRMNDALNVQQLLKKVKSSNFDIMTFNPYEKKVVIKQPKKQKEPEKVPEVEKEPDGSNEVAAIRAKINKNDLALMTNLKIKAFQLKKKYPNNPRVVSLLDDIKRMTAPKFRTCSSCGGTGQRKTVCKKCQGAKQATCGKCIGSGMKISRVTCPDCKGKGRNWLGIQCKTCKGKGKVVQKVKCPNCKGSGKVTCTACKGTGTIKEKCPTCKGTGKIKN